MKFGVAFSVDVDSVDGTNLEEACEKKPTLATRVREAVEMAVTEALRHAQGEGHTHNMQDEISILMDSHVTARKL